MRLRSIDVTPGAIKSARFIKPSTIIHYERCIRSLNLFFGPMVLRKIHLGHIPEYQEARLEGRAPFIRYRRPRDANPTMRFGVEIPAKGKTPCPVKPGQVNQEIGVLTAILRRARVWTKEMEDFFEQVQADGSDGRRALTPEEQQRWIDICGTNERWTLILWYSIVAYDSTCSTNELRSLRIADVNLHHQTLYIPWEGSKNGTRHRTIAIEDADTLYALERLLARAKELGSVEATDYLFPCGLRGKGNHYDPKRHMTVQGFKRKWDEVRAAAQLPNFTPYHTRATGITRLAERGVPLAVAMARAGHMSPEMSQWYTQVSDSAQRRWMQQPRMLQPIALPGVQPTTYNLPPQQFARAGELPGYTTIYIGGIPISIPTANLMLQGEKLDATPR